MSQPCPDTIIRLALAMLAADVRAEITTAQRTWLVERLAAPARPLTACERARLYGPLMAYLKTYYPRSRDIVARHFVEAQR